MRDTEVESLIHSLEQEIRLNEDSLEKTDSLVRLKEIAERYNGEDKVVSFGDIAKSILLNPNEETIMSGWQGLDDLLKGFRRQQLIVVSAATKSGKTSWLMDLTTRIKDSHPLWFPFEESAEELIRKFMERGEEPPLGYAPEMMKGSAIDWIESRIIESIAKYNTRVVIIDQLDFIVPMGGDNHHLNIAKTMRDLKGIAKKWNIVIFIICHLQKTKMDVQPTTEDLRGSSSIAQEADTVILLWREAKREMGQVVITDNVNISVQANRRFGKTGNVKMVYREGHFTEEDVSAVPLGTQGNLANF